jgi:hypothetical protein
MGAFGTTGARGRHWQTHEMVETHDLLTPGGLLGVTEIVVGEQRIEIVVEWWSAGRRLRQRPKFRCPCGRTVKYLHEKDGRFVCRPCSGYEHSSRHVRRWGPIDMIRKLRAKIGADPTPFAPLKPTSRRRGVDAICARIIAKEAVLAAKLEKMVSDLSKRAKRECHERTG